MSIDIRMDGLTFVAEIVKSLAWPASAIILVILLRKPIVELIPFIRKLRYKELELEFSQEVKALKAETSDIPDFDKTKEKISATSKALALLPLSTRAAIMEAWVEVETAAVEAASSFWNKSPSEAMRNFPRLGEYLHQSKVINDQQLRMFQKLRQLRNKAAHAEELSLSEEDAKAFVVMASNLANHIRNA